MRAGKPILSALKAPILQCNQDVPGPEAPGAGGKKDQDFRAKGVLQHVLKGSGYEAILPLGRRWRDQPGKA
jgi:hypothetical protein